MGKAFKCLNMARECPECGALDSLCRERFYEFLGLEFSDPEYGTVHHLTVMVFMLQHSSRQTCEGWLGMRDLLDEFLVQGKPPELVRMQTKYLVDNGNRNYTNKSTDGQLLIEPSIWNKTALDIRMDDSQIYHLTVTDWA